jgi:hypothetical protein
MRMQSMQDVASRRTVFPVAGRGCSFIQPKALLKSLLKRFYSNSQIKQNSSRSTPKA